MPPLLIALFTLRVVLAAGDDRSQKSIDNWELRPPCRNPSTVMFGGVNACAEEQRSGCFGPWFSLFFCMTVKLGALKPESMAV